MTRTLALTDLVDAPPADDVFRYGWRTVLHPRRDGSLESEQLPLTLWDVLHPQEGDQIVQSSRHDTEVSYLAAVIRSQIAQDERALLLSDTAVYWDKTGLSHHCPDIALLFDLRRQKDNWTSFFVAIEGVRPSLIIEVVSPHIREVDVVTKLAEYHKAEVPMYVIVDRKKEEEWPKIRGYLWEPGEYRALALDDRDCLLLPMLNLRLCANQNRIMLCDALTGEEMGDYTAIREAKEAAEQEVRLAQERLLEEATAREKAEEFALEADAAREKAEGLALEAITARKKAEGLALEEGAARKQAESANAELMRQLDELRAKLQQQPGS